MELTLPASESRLRVLVYEAWLMTLATCLILDISGSSATEITLPLLAS